MDNSPICRHNLFTMRCLICKYICKHGKQKSRCFECGGTSLCIHKREKYYCRECRGTGICKHQNYKKTCKICKLEKNKLIDKKIDYFLNDPRLLALMEFYILQLGC